MHLDPFIFTVGTIFQFTAAVVYTLHVWRPHRIRGSFWVGLGLWMGVAWFLTKIMGFMDFPAGVFLVAGAASFFVGSVRIGLHLAEATAERNRLRAKIASMRVEACRNEGTAA